MKMLVHLHLCIRAWSSQSTIDLKYDKSFLCSEPGGPEGIYIHNASTHNTDHDAIVRKCAIALILEDTTLLAKLEPGDMIALEAKYHRKCLAN